MFTFGEVQYSNKKFYKNSQHFLSNACLYSGASGNYKLIIMQFTDPFLYIIFTSIECDYVKFARYNLKVMHH
jgi:hypothetical protein